MTDKNVQRGAQQQQWPKTVPSTTATPAAINAAIGIGLGSDDGKTKHLHTPYDLTGVLSSNNFNPYGIALVGLAGSGGGSTTAMPEIVPHTHAHPNTGYARFQPPPIHTHPHSHPGGVSVAVAPAAASPSTHGITNLSHAPSAVTSNVPVFVPPTFSAAPTSVLTPNPFAMGGSSANSGATATPFTLEHHQFQAQHLSKFMNAVNSAASLASTSTSLMGGAAGATPFPVTLLPNTPQAQTPSTVASTVPSANIIATATVAAHSPQANRTPTIEMSAGSSSSGGVGAGAAAGSATSNNNTNAGVITTTIAENVLSVICANANPNASSVTPVHGRLLGMGVQVPDEEKMHRIQSVIEAGVSEHSKRQILQILDRIATLKPIEKLLLYLRLPGEAPETDPLRHPQNPLGTRSEINHTINWVRSHLEHDPQVSIPKQDVYDDYIAYCERLEIKPLSTADFGKVMKQVFPGIRPRRLGTRGHSRYCYAAMRKTTKLTPPQLPQLGTTPSAAGPATDSDVANADESAMMPRATVSGIPMQTGDLDTWQTVKAWAEKLLNVKLDSVGELAARIKTNNALGLGPLPTNVAKKYAQREPKEKRQQVDMGPLKKRRKKKRKGSSSSESSQCALPQGGSVSVDSTLTSPSTTLAGNTRTFVDTSHDQEQKPIKMVKVKQEILDSPNYAQVQQLASTHMQTATLTDIGATYMEGPQQHQMLPMNLAPEQRTVVPNKMLQHGSTPTAVKNLTPKIMEIANSSKVLVATETAPTIPATTTTAIITEPMPPIKEEIIDDYNPTNIICKKVRKAQQTKGFLAAVHSPLVATSAASSPPIATTVISSAMNATPPPPAVTPVAAAAVADTPNITYSMGPPAQMISTTTNSISSSSGSSPSTSATLTPVEVSNAAAGVIPKVASRNWSRAKRLQMTLAAAAAAAEANANELAGGDKDADLPDSLGLPRERVISICNMDKHELDDYFLPGDEESQDQDTELLQYFQTGDAEDKLNSLDANKLRTPTVAPQANVSNNNNSNVNANIGSERKPSNACMVVKQQNCAVIPTAIANLQAAHSGGNSGGGSGSGFMAVEKTANNAAASPAIAVNTATATAANTVGSASASLALMSQKHQQQQQQQQQQISGNKRKITFDHGQRLAPTRKNCIFMPINSPNNGSSHSNSNNNNTSNNNGTAPYGAAINGDSSSYFASPSAGLSRTRSKPAFSKQQSLDCEDSSAGSDPMIGANRRRRSYANFLPSSTSASAPPSPSVLQQQQRELFGTQTHFFGGVAASVGGAQGVSWALGNGGGNSASYSHQIGVEQNSLDLDLFGSASGGCGYATQNSSLVIEADECGPPPPPLSETQRSQSVPLSQLQRIHSPTFNRLGGGFQSVSNYSACASVAPTPVPPEFGGENTLFSENSNSQQSVTSHNNNGNQVNTAATTGVIKLDENVVLASDSTAMLDDVDVSDILSSSDFVSKFSSIAHTSSSGMGGATTTTCSSSGSSSGYSSAGGTNGSSGGVGSIFSGNSLNTSLNGGIVSRSVPSTPLPHHHHNVFGNMGVYGRRRGNDETHLLSPTELCGSPAMTMSFRACTGNKYGIGGGGNNINCGNSVGGHNCGTRSTYDMSKSMPTTPITTPCFRYSPTEFSRDYLLNSIDSMSAFGTTNSTAGGGGSNSLLMDANAAADSADDIVSIGATLINSDCGVEAEVFADGVVGAANDNESIMVGADLLGNL